MQWVDVAGPPGVGKSTLATWGNREVAWPEQPLPSDWRPFIEEMVRLLALVDKHPSAEAAHRMCRRSVFKMATVHRMPQAERGPYVQTALAQRGLGLGWRLVDMGADLNELRPFFRLMPVSLGVVFLEAPPDVIAARNLAREQVPETAHENRAFMIAPMLPAIELAKEVLRERGVPVATIDTSQPLDIARAELIAFASGAAGDASPVGLGGEVAAVQPLP